MRAEVEIPTTRLVLHGVDPAQAEELARGISPLPCVAGYPHADSDTAARMQRHALEVDNWVPGYGLYLMMRRADGLVVGDIGFHTPPDQRGAAEVSYGVADSVRRRGYASEALVALTAWAHAHGASTVLAEVDPTNHASRGVLAKAGFLPVRSDGPKLRLRHQG
ncbi:Acetyltransferase [Propionibacterium freudenreichii subsp. shermanii]|nr:Acetyltransferase [Propionibacterium freudenreichii subsp. shermanii]